MNFVDPALADFATGETLFAVLAAQQGEVYREVAFRRTFQFEFRGDSYFAKIHFGVGWKEVFKNLLQARLPIIGATNELLAIQRLDELCIDTMSVVGFSKSGRNPAHQRSCIVTKALIDTISIEDLFEAGPIELSVKYRLIKRVAQICRAMHEGGVNHRDLYVCHFHLDLTSMNTPEPRIHVIDLHRAQIRGVTPRRWLIKDIGGLLFSVLNEEVTIRDLFRFMRIYRGKSLRRTLREDAVFWQAVLRRAHRLYKKETGDSSPLIEALQTGQQGSFVRPNGRTV